MKKNYFLHSSHDCICQRTRTGNKIGIKNRFDVIRNETVTGANSKTRLANAYQELADGTISVYPVALTGTDTYSGSLQGLDAYTGKIVLSRLKTQIQEHQRPTSEGSER